MLTNLLTYTVLTFLHFEIPYMYTRGESWGASSGFGPEGRGNNTEDGWENMYVDIGQQGAVGFVSYSFSH